MHISPELEAVIHTLCYADADEHRRAMLKLRILGDPVDLFAQAMQDERDHVRHYAVKGIRAFRDTRIPAILRSALHDGASLVRAEAAIGLGEWPDGTCVDALCDLLRDESPRVGAAAAEALGRVGNAAAVPALCRALEPEDTQHNSVREKVMEALGSIGDPRAVPPLLRVLHEDFPPYIPKRAAEALSRIAERSPTSLLHNALPLLQRRRDTSQSEERPTYDAAIRTIQEALRDHQSFPLPAAAPDEPQRDLPLPSAPFAAPAEGLPIPYNPGQEQVS